MRLRVVERDLPGAFSDFPTTSFPNLNFLFGMQWHRIGLLARFPPWPTPPGRAGQDFVSVCSHSLDKAVCELRQDDPPMLLLVHITTVKIPIAGI